MFNVQCSISNAKADWLTGLDEAENQVLVVQRPRDMEYKTTSVPGLSPACAYRPLRPRLSVSSGNRGNAHCAIVARQVPRVLDAPPDIEHWTFERWTFGRWTFAGEAHAVGPR